MSLLAHVLAPCKDPDCEIHRIEVGLAEETVKDSDLAFFIAGAQYAQEAGGLDRAEWYGRERVSDDAR